MPLAHLAPELQGALPGLGVGTGSISGSRACVAVSVGHRTFAFMEGTIGCLNPGCFFNLSLQKQRMPSNLAF